VWVSTQRRFLTAASSDYRLFRPGRYDVCYVERIVQQLRRGPVDLMHEIGSAILEGALADFNRLTPQILAAKLDQIEGTEARKFRKNVMEVTF
jgi:hypothetical protein